MHSTTDVAFNLGCLLIGLACTFLVGVVQWNWQWTATRAVKPAGERRMPLLPDRVVRTPPVLVGYRGMQAGVEVVPVAVPLVFDRARPRRDNVRVLRNPAHVAVRIDLSSRRYAVVRIEASREGDEAVVRAFAHAPLDVAEWASRERDVLDPIMDDLLEELTGTTPSDRPATTAEDAIDRRGWPKR